MKQLPEEVNKILGIKEHFLTFVLNEMSDMVVVQDLEFNIIWANRVAYKEARLLDNIPKNQDLISNKCYKVFHGLNNPCIDCALLKSIQTKQQHLIERWDEKKKKWFLYNVFPIFEENKLNGIAYIISDITEKKKMEQNLRETYILHNLILNNVDMAILTSDRHGIITTYNKAAEQIFGWTLNEVIGKHNKIFYKKDEFEALMENILKDIEQKGQYIGIVNTLHKSGEEILSSLSVTPILDSKNKLKGYVGIARKLT